MLSKDKEKTLILVFGPEKEADLLSEVRLLRIIYELFYCKKSLKN